MLTVDTMIVIYLSGWALTSVGAYAARKCLVDRIAPAPHPCFVSVVAGAMWPLLVVGLIELGAVVVATKTQRRSTFYSELYA